MEDAEIGKLLQGQHGKASRRGWRCPDENKLAAYVGQSLSGSARNSVEAHLVDCDFCLGQVAFLTHSSDWVNSEAVPAQLLSRARKLVTRKPGKVITLGWRWAVSAAAVACFVLVFAFVVLQVRRQPSVSLTTGPLIAQASPEPVASPQLNAGPPALRSESPRAVATKTKRPLGPSIVRGKTVDDLFPKLISPRDGAVVRRKDLEFRWEQVSEAIFYEVRIMSAEGDLVFEGQTENTILKPGSTAPLVPGMKYFASIRAHLRQGKAAKSSLVSFKLAEQ
jgi:hypothetical protein